MALQEINHEVHVRYKYNMGSIPASRVIAVTVISLLLPASLMALTVIL